MHTRGTPSKLTRLLREETGQTLVFVLLCLTGAIGLAGISMDMGHGFYAYEELKASTNAAAMAGAQGLPNTTTATSNVSAYSAASGDHNYTPVLTNATTSVSFKCLSSLTNLGILCLTTSGTTGGYNAVQVKQSAQVQTWFAKMFGISSFNINATATAAKAGGANTPWNIAIILDTTGSMASKDSGTQCSGTQISCALLGVQALLKDLSPCPLNVTCSSSTTPVDSVSLYVFPPVLATTASKDYGNGSCPTSAPTHEWYTVPTLPAAWTYQIVTYSNDYRTSDASTSLDTSSDIVIAAGGAGCTGITAPGGAGTYYAQVIYQAQSDLVAQQKLYPGSQNAMIILSDGDATSTVTYTSSKDTAISTSSDLQPSATNSLNGVAFNNPNSYTYPSAVGECGQAVQAAQTAATGPNSNGDPGTVVYTVGYGSETSGCTTDSKYSGSYTAGWSSWGPGDSPCQALAAMASSAANFYSDDGNGCASTNQTNFTQLTQIFQAIAQGLTVPRLVPNGTT
jgi:hypothetical protein